MTDAVQRIFMQRVRRLPEHTQRLLLVAAADETCRLATVLVAPIISEKATMAAEKHNQVLFKVLRNASKPEIKADEKSEETAEAGRAWVREMTQLIKGIDPVRPVTCGLDQTCLNQNTGLRVDQVYAETDIAVMHSYPMYTPWARPCITCSRGGHRITTRMRTS